MIESVINQPMRAITPSND